MQSSARLATAALLCLAMAPNTIAQAAEPAAPLNVADPVAATAQFIAAVDNLLLSSPAKTASISSLTPAPSLSASADVTAGNDQVAYETTKAERFRTWALSHQDTYTSVKSSMDVQSTKISGNRASVAAHIVTTMLWSSSATASETLSAEKKADVAKAAADGRAFAVGQTVTSAVASDHVVTLTQEAGKWKVVTDSYIDPFNESLAADHRTPRETSGANSAQEPVKSLAASASTGDASKAGTSSVAPMGMIAWDRQAAANYADTYWSNYNPNYPNCNSSGGDCANFVSQALWSSSGGNLPSESPYWYWPGTTSCSATPIAWRYTPSQHSFFVSNPFGSGYNFAQAESKGSATATRAFNQSSMLVGDVIFYDWHSDGVIDHVAIDAAYASDSQTLIDAHNTNHYHVRWDFIGYSNTTYYQDKFWNTITYP